MTEDNPQEENLTEELQKIGRNLVDVLKAAWERPERRQLQEEIVRGLTDVGSTLRQEMERFAQSPAGQQMKADVEQMREQVRSGEAQAKVRTDLLAALRLANAELEKAIQNLSSSKTEEPQGQSSSGEDETQG